MKINLEIDNYPSPNGFSAETINCIDIPIAGAAGYFNKMNYYYYIFNYCCFHNWYPKYLTNFEAIRVILKSLGIIIHKIEVDSIDDLIPLIQDQLMQKKPVLFPISYRSLFYNPWTYLEPKSTGNHLLIISAFNKSKKTITIRDTTHVAAAGLPELEGYKNFRKIGLYNLQLTEILIDDMWKISNEDFRKQNSYFLHKLFSLEQITPPQIYSDKTLLSFFYSNFNIEESQLIHLIKRVNAVKTRFEPETVRNHFYSCMNAFFDILERIIIRIPIDEQQHNIFKRLRDDYLIFRNNLTTKIIAEKFRGEDLELDVLSKLISKCYTMDKRLFLYIKKLTDTQPNRIA